MFKKYRCTELSRVVSHVGIRENCIDRCQPKHGQLAVVDIMLLEISRSFAAKIGGIFSFYCL